MLVKKDNNRSCLGLGMVVPVPMLLRKSAMVQPLLPSIAHPLRASEAETCQFSHKSGLHNHAVKSRPRTYIALPMYVQGGED